MIVPEYLESPLNTKTRIKGFSSSLLGVERRREMSFWSSGSCDTDEHDEQSGL